MITIRKSADRGKVNMGWLDSRHTFSFGHYFDPEHMGFGNLRVINEDWIRPGKGFGTHPHDNMEILTYVVEGALEHRDSMDNGSVIRPGDVQRMTAGTGVTHSEFNHSQDDPVHLLQIWILPETRGLEPGYEEKRFDREHKLDRLRLIASRDGRDDSVTIHQDADLYAGILSPGTELTHVFRDGRRGWLQVITGEVTLDDVDLSAGDAAAIEEVDAVAITATKETELLLFDLA
ncbi:MAG: pirin family protein [Woeseiaceae bacterium]|nr:pirin family protein [Woeseiaceae bacterium]